MSSNRARPLFLVHPHVPSSSLPSLLLSNFLSNFYTYSPNQPQICLSLSIPTLLSTFILFFFLHQFFNFITILSKYIIYLLYLINLPIHIQISKYSLSFAIFKIQLPKLHEHHTCITINHICSFHVYILINKCATLCPFPYLPPLGVWMYFLFSLQLQILKLRTPRTPRTPPLIPRTHSIRQ